MGCNCKTNAIDTEALMANSSGSKISIGQNVLKYSLKTLVFLLVLILLPIINLAIIWFIFRTVVLNKDIDIKPLLLSIGSKFQNKDDESDDDDYDELTEDDVVMVDVEELPIKTK